ncbi:cell division protein SepF [Agrilactobacillus fermenti]|uniref:cell division protein SepF n=1 Tax=Agrilactobacillus fermenti TaxID=2586909 RepID=UPI001E2D9FE6|nr:cell division protein SepF [Agrilactobacillus fermenti]MCD2255308.1 cell division protein SepF [Agrilactobacillus fermenti]
MGFEKISRFFGMNDDDFNDLGTNETETPKSATVKTAYETVPPISQSTSKTNVNNNVVSMDTVKSNQTTKIVLFEPRVYSDAKEVGTHLINGRAVIVNFTRIDEKQAKRILDFLTGTIFAIKGEVQRVGDCIFLCTPSKFEIDGSITDIIRKTKVD